MNNEMIKGLIKAVVIVGIAYALFYYFSYQKWSNKSLDNIDVTYRESNDNIKESKDKEDNTNDKDYRALYELVKFEFLEYNYGEGYFDYYYSNKPFDSEFYIYYSIISLMNNENVVNCNLEKDFSVSEVTTKINEVFGDIPFEHKSFTTSNNYLNVIYDDVNQLYKVKVNNKCGGFDFTNGGIKNEYYKYVMVNDSLLIYEKAFYLKYSTGNNGNIVFNYYNGLTSNSKIVGTKYDELNLDEFDTYVYRFEKKNGRYVFVSISREV